MDLILRCIQRRLQMQLSMARKFTLQPYRRSVFRIRIHFLWIRIRIQWIRMEANTDPDPIRIQGFNDQKFKKISAEKKKTAIYLSLGLHKVCPGYRRSLQLTKEAIQHFKTWIFSTFVGHLCPPGSGSGSVFKLRIRIRIQWSDWIRIQSGSGSGSVTLPQIERKVLQNM